MSLMRFVWMWLMMAAANAEYYDNFSGKRLSRQQIDLYNASGLLIWCAIDVDPCTKHEGRRDDGTCNNVKFPSRGSMFTPFKRLLQPRFGANFDVPAAASGAPLPNARLLRTSIIGDGRVSSSYYTQMMTYAMVALAGEFTTAHDTVNFVIVTRTCCQPGGENDPRCLPISVPSDDVHLRRSNVRCLNQTRPVTFQQLGCAPTSLPPERLNLALPMLELSLIYGSSKNGTQKIRSFIGGQLLSQSIDGKEWPLDGSPVCLLNQRARGETRCHSLVNPGVNTILGLNIVFLWWFRSHNALARELELLNPCWSDERLFRTARNINTALFQHIMYYETFTELLDTQIQIVNPLTTLFQRQEYLQWWGVVYPGLHSEHVDDYDPKLEPAAYFEFSITMRWFHAMQEGRLDKYDEQGRVSERVNMVDFTLRTGALALNGTFAGMTRGAIVQPAAEIDQLVDPDMGERVLSNLQVAADVLSNDISKGRVGGLQPYVQYRKLCGLSVPKTFSDLEEYMTYDSVVTLRQLYDSVEEIELYPALLVERPSGKKAVVGDTIACLIATQLRYWRRADRFWFEHPNQPGAFTPDQLVEIRRGTWAWLLCAHGDGVDRVQRRALLLPGPHNKVVSCLNIPSPNLHPWQEESHCDIEDAPRPPRPVPSDFSRVPNMNRFTVQPADPTSPTSLNLDFLSMISN